MDHELLNAISDMMQNELKPDLMQSMRDMVQDDVDILKKVVVKHSDKLQRLA